jgi:hypothetical protein
VEIKKSNEIQTDRNINFQAKKANGKTGHYNLHESQKNNIKISTEVNDNISNSNYQQKDFMNMRESNFRNYNSNTNDSEMTERISYLKTIVDKVPRLNLEVELYNQ